MNKEMVCVVFLPMLVHTNYDHAYYSASFACSNLLGVCYADFKLTV